MAEEYLKRQGVWEIATGPVQVAEKTGLALTRLRKEISATAGAPMIIISKCDRASFRFTQRQDLPKISQQGPATPDHVIGDNFRRA